MKDTSSPRQLTTDLASAPWLSASALSSRRSTHLARGASDTAQAWRDRRTTPALQTSAADIGTALCVLCLQSRMVLVRPPTSMPDLRGILGICW